MAYIGMEDLLKNAQGSLYKLVTLASRRALELSAGSEALVDGLANKKVTSKALEEIRKGKIGYKLAKKS